MQARRISLDTLNERIAALGEGVPDGATYQEFSGLVLDHPAVGRLSALDPFSPEYRALAMELYRALSGRQEGYEPARDEQSHLALPDNIWTGLTPWSFRHPALIAEFLASWARIFRLLDLPPGGTARVLEYGCGTGQLLLMLARAGLEAHGVDIDSASLDAARRQAEALGLELRLEQAAFGEGFGEERFDRIIFFEAFHHAWEFPALLGRLRDRLAPEGRIILCGEPVVPGPTDAVPFPWGPRLDALSIFCMRRWGWMELGFRHDFLVEACRRAGWRVTFHPDAECGRAAAYVLQSALDGVIRMGEPQELGRYAAGWSAPEGTHRWTLGGTAIFPLPGQPGEALEVTLRMMNPLPVRKQVRITAGEKAWTLTMEPGELGRDIALATEGAAEIGIQAEGHRPAGLIPGSADQRLLGIAVVSIQCRTRIGRSGMEPAGSAALRSGSAEEGGRRLRRESCGGCA